MIEVEHLTKDYGAFHALRDVSFNVEKGEILGFLGPNGAGKTTTMRVITGFIPATSGTVRVAGSDVADKSLEARRHLGYLPETVPLYTELTPVEYLDFRGRIAGMHNKRERKATIFSVMDRLNILEVANKQIGALSRGYRQRVGLAQAMLHNPDVLILDEPTVGLDPVQITGVRDLIKELGQDHTIILSTHLLPEVSMVCNRVVIINRGRLVAVDTPLHLASTSADVQTVQVEVAGSPVAVLDALGSTQGVARATLANGSNDGAQATTPRALPAGEYTYKVESGAGADIRSAVASAVVNSGNRLLELRVFKPTLEDIFINVITQDEQAALEEESFGQDDYYNEENDPVEEPVAAAPVVRERVVTKRRTRG